MSREERRKKLKEEGIIEINSNSYNNIVNRSRENQKIASQHNSKLPTSIKSQVDNLYNKNNVQQNDMWERVKARAQNIMNSTNYISQKFSGGIISGITGIGQSGITEFANNLKIGKDKKSNEIIQDVLSGLNPTINPTKMYTSLMKKTIKDNVNILKNKDSNTLEKGVNTITQTVSNAINSLPVKKQIDTVQQIVGKIANENASKEMLKLNEKISEPSEKINQMLAEESKKHGKITNYVGDAMQSIGNMTPSIGAKILTGNPAIGLGVMGISAKGQSTQESLNKGMNLQEAINIGNTKGAIEIGTEMLTGGVNIFGKGALDEIVEKGIDKKVINKVLNGLAHYGYDVTGEVLEETISDILGTVIDKGTVDPNAKYGVKDWADTAITTMLSTTILNLLTGGLAGGNKIQQSENQQTTIENEQVLNNNQQTIQEQGKSAQNQNSEQINNTNQNSLSQEENSKIISEKIESKTYKNSENAKIFLESAVNNNFDIKSKEIETISKILDNRNLKGSFNSDVFNGDTNKSALYVKGEVILNPKADSKKGLYDLVIHETAHSMLDNNTELKNTILETLKTDSRYEQMYNDIASHYSEEYKNSDNFQKDVEEEMIADYLGENLSTEEFMTKLSEAQKTKNQSKVKQVIDNFIQKIKEFFTSRFGTGIKETDAEKYYWNKVENLFYDTYLNSENVSNENNKYSIGGKVAKENLIKSDGNNVKLEKMYNQALKLANQKVDNETIRKQTHWFQDKNGDWKFEFSDKDMKLKKFLKANSNYKLGEILEHNVLFELYPSLKNYNVKAQDFSNINTKGTLKNETIYVSNKLLKSNRNIEKTLIHEIQHAIQNIENFEKGRGATKSKLAYYNSLGEIEATNVASRFINEKYNDKSLMDTPPESSKINPKHEKLDNYLENRRLIDKIKDKVYNSVKEFLEKESSDYSENFEENLLPNNEKSSKNVFQVDGKGSGKAWIRLGNRYNGRLNSNLKQGLENKSSSFSLPKNPNILINTKGRKIDISNLQETSQMKLNNYNRKYNEESIVAYRGVSENTGNNFAMYGLGLYTTLDKNYASKYGDVEIVDSKLLPENPLKFKTQNDFKMWEQDLASQLGIRYSELLGTDYGIEKYVKKLGYDGLMIGTGKDTDLISFKENKANPSDAKYSQNIEGEWNQYLKETSRNNETRKTLGEVKLPQKKKIRLPQDLNKLEESKEELIKSFKEETEKLGTTMSIDEQVQSITQKTNEKVKQSLPDPNLNIVNKLSKEKHSFKSLTTELRKLITNRGAGADDLFKATGNKRGTWKYDRYLGSFSEGQVSIGINQVNSNGEVVGKSLLEIYDKAKKDRISQYDLDQYMYNKDNMARYNYEKGLYGETITSKDSEKVVKAYEKRFPKIAEYGKELSNYANNDTKSYLVGTFISEDLYSHIREMYPDHIPVIRDISDTPGMNEYDNIGSQVLKNAKGGNKDILSAKEALASQSVSYAKAYRRNEALKEVYKSIKADTKVLYDLGKIQDIEQANLEIQNAVGYDESLKKYTATIFENGEAKIFEISKDIYDAFIPSKAMTAFENTIDKLVIGKVLKKSTNAFKSLTTGKNILFALKNMVVDVNDAPINSKTNIANYMKDYTYAYEQISTNGKWFKEYINSGGGANTFYDYNKGLLKAENQNKLKIGLDFINEQTIGRVETINEVVEMAPRLAEYIATREKGGSIDEALYNASEVTTNFKRGGALTKLIDKYGVPYLNASVQGLCKVYRNISEAKGFKGYSRLIVSSALAGVMPSLLNHLIYEDDDDYEALEDYLKDGYYLLKIKNPEKLPENIQDFLCGNNFIRIPKGRISAVLGDTAVKMYETIRNNKEVWNGYIGDVILNNIGINNPITNNLFAPLIKQAVKNEAWYGGNIYSESKYKNMLPVEITDEKTDKFSNWVAQTLYDMLPEETYKKLSNKENGNALFKVLSTPKLLNYVLDQYSGFIGDFVLPMLTPYAENNPIVDQFTTSSTLKNKTVSEFYELLGNNYQDSEYATDTDKLTYQYLSTVSKDIGSLYADKASIQNDDNLSDKEKRNKSLDIQKEINEKMQVAITNIKEMKVTEKTASFNGIEYYKNEKEEWKEISEKDIEKGLSTETYADYKNKMAIATEQKRKSEGKEDVKLNDKEQISLIKNSTYTDIEKQIIYSKYINKDDEIYDVISKLEDGETNIDEYLDYKIQKFESDENTKSNIVGKKVSKGEGTTKSKTLNYIDNSKMTNLEKAYIVETKYSGVLDSKQLEQLVNIVKKKITDKEELEEVLKRFKDFEQHKDDGKYYSK